MIIFFRLEKLITFMLLLEKACKGVCKGNVWWELWVFDDSGGREGKLCFYRLEWKRERAMNVHQYYQGTQVIWPRGLTK